MTTVASSSIKPGRKMGRKPVSPKPDLIRALCDACIAGDPAAARLLLDRGADVNASNIRNGTPLFYACFHGHPDIVRLLLDRGARVDVTDSGGYTPLHWACWGGSAKALKLVMEKSRIVPVPAGVNHNNGVLPFVGNIPTPLYIACKALNVDMVRLLVEDRPVDDLQGVSSITAAHKGHSPIDIVLTEMLLQPEGIKKVYATEIYEIFQTLAPEAVLDTLLEKPETTERNNLLEIFRDRFPEAYFTKFCESQGRMPGRGM